MGFWKIRTKDGRELSELDGIKWKDIKDNISELIMSTNDGKFIFLPKNMPKYLQAKTASADLGGNGNVTIESRFIGFKYKDVTIVVRVNEKNNNITIEVT